MAIKIIITLILLLNIGITFYAVYFTLPKSGTYTMTVDDMREQQLKQVVGTIIFLCLVWFNLL